MTTFNISNFLLKHVSIDQPEHLKNFSPYSRKKAVMMASLVLIPTILWIITGYIWGTSFMGYNAWSSLLIGLVMGFFIFLFEKAILVARGNKWLALSRFLMSIAFAFVGGEAINSKLFAKDIEAYDKRNAEQQSQFFADSLQHSYELRLVGLRKNRDQYDSLYRLMQDKAIIEADGSGGTGRRGAGKITDLKKQTAETFRLSSIQQGNLHDQLLKERDSLIGVKSEFFSDLHLNSGSLDKLHSLHEVAFSNTSNTLVFLVLCFIMLFLELGVVIFKTLSKETAYEKALEYREAQQIQELNILRNKVLLHQKRKILSEMMADNDQLKNLF